MPLAGGGSPDGVLERAQGGDVPPGGALCYQAPPAEVGQVV